MSAPFPVGTPGVAVFSPNNVATPQSLSPSPGSGYSIGDVLLCFTACRLGTATVATPTGWTQLLNITGTNGRLALFGKIATSTSEPAPIVTWSGLTTGTSGSPCGARIQAFAGLSLDIDVTGAIENGAASTTVSASGLAMTIPSEEDLALCLSTRLDDAGTWSAPSGLAMINSNLTTSGADFSFAWAYGSGPASGSFVPNDFGLVGASSFASSGVAIALKKRQPVTYYGVIDRPFTFQSSITGEKINAVLYDDFNRVDGAIYAGAGASLWMTNRLDYDAISNSKVIGNALGQTLPGGTYEQAVSTQKIGPGDFDIFIDCVATGSSPNEIAIWFLVDNVGAAAANLQGYVLISSSLSNYWAIRKYVNGVNQGVISGPDTTKGPIVAGDTIWIKKRGLGHYFFRKPSGGSYTEIFLISFGDVTFSEGYVAIETSDPTIRWDNLRGSFAPAGPKTVYGQTAFPISFAKDVKAKRQTFGQTARPISFGAVVNGRRKTLGQVALPVTFSKEVNAGRKTFGQLTSPFLFSKDIRAQRKTYGQITSPFTANIDIKGSRVGLTLYGATSLSILFEKDIRGLRKAFGQVTFPISFGKDIKAQRRTFGQISLPIIFIKEAVGQRQAFGQLLMQTLFGKETAAQRKTFGQMAVSLNFTKDIKALKKTFGQISRPINFVAFIDGQSSVGIKTYYSSFAMPISFEKQVSAYRKTFGQTASPFIFGSSSQGRRTTFGEIERPFDFLTDIEIGFVEVHGKISLPIIVSIDTNGNVRPVGIILNDAESIYLGERIVEAVYVGDEKVWSFYLT